MVIRGMVALLAAVGMMGLFVAPGAAQSCADFGSQKDAQRQLEQVGDTSGALDPDGNGYACEGYDYGSSDGGVVSNDASGNNGTVINSDGPVASDSAGGVSGMVVATNPGNQAERTNEGINNQARDRADRESRGNRASRGGDEPAGDGGAPVDGASDTGGGGGGDGSAPIQLPNTGSGPLSAPGSAAIIALLGMAAMLAIGAWRRVRAV